MVLRFPVVNYCEQHPTHWRWGDKNRHQNVQIHENISLDLVFLYENMKECLFACNFLPSIYECYRPFTIMM